MDNLQQALSDAEWERREEYWKGCLRFALQLLVDGQEPHKRPARTKNGKLTWYRVTGEDMNRWSNAAMDAEKFLRKVLDEADAVVL